AERKRLQVETAPKKTTKAKLIKLADKISNVRDVTASPPPWWDFARRVEYLNWTERVVAGLRGASPELEALYDHVLAEGREKLSEEAQVQARQ
ncbi:MAG TPA: phosphohydrolase, partial [Blastocatellia bacterium]